MVWLYNRWLSRKVILWIHESLKFAFSNTCDSSWHFFQDVFLTCYVSSIQVVHHSPDDQLPQNCQVEFTLSREECRELRLEVPNIDRIFDTTCNTAYHRTIHIWMNYIMCRIQQYSIYATALYLIHAYRLYCIFYVCISSMSLSIIFL